MLRSYPVITSKAAEKDLNNIKATHATLLKGMALQNDKVAAYKQNKQAELQAKQTMQAQMEKEKAIADTQAKKDAMTFAQKEAELSIKRAALSAV